MWQSFLHVFCENHRNNPDSGRMYAVYTGVRKGRVGLGWGGSVEGGCVVFVSP